MLLYMGHSRCLNEIDWQPMMKAVVERATYIPEILLGNQLCNMVKCRVTKISEFAKIIYTVRTKEVHHSPPDRTGDIQGRFGYFNH